MEKVKITVKKYGMLEDGDKVVCGFSGGADSSALVVALKEIIPAQNIIACHINHMIRGEEAERDAEFCREKCKSWGVEFVRFDIDIPKIVASEGGSTEEIGRRERYSAFERVCRGKNCGKIAVAHNAQDNLETMLFNLARGTALKGLCGIPPVRNNIIRPLIECPREDIEDFLKEMNEDFVCDSTNAENIYSRNLIRNEIIPKLKKISPHIVKNAVRTSVLLRCDEKALSDIALTGKTDFGNESLLSRKLIDEYKKITGEALAQVNVGDCIRLIKSGALHSSVSLPHAVSLRITRDGYVFEKDAKEEKTEEFCLFLKEGNNTTPNGDVVFKKDKNGTIIIYTLETSAQFSCSIITGNIYVRNRMEGDNMLVGGYHKTLKKLLNEKKVTLEKRKKLICFCDDNGIFYIPGVAKRSMAKKEKIM